MFSLEFCFKFSLICAFFSPGKLGAFFQSLLAGKLNFSPTMSLLRRFVPYLAFGFLSLCFESGCFLFVFYVGLPLCLAWF